MDTEGALDMFISPKRRKQRATHVDQSGAVQFLPVEALHQKEIPLGTPLGLEARVLHVPSEPRLSTINNRSTGQDEQVAVITVVLAARTGPILWEAWREVAEKLWRFF